MKVVPEEVTVYSAAREETNHTMVDAKARVKVTVKVTVKVRNVRNVFTISNLNENPCLASVLRCNFVTFNLSVSARSLMKSNAIKSNPDLHMDVANTSLCH